MKCSKKLLNEKMERFEKLLKDTQLDDTVRRSLILAAIVFEKQNKTYKLLEHHQCDKCKTDSKYLKQISCNTCAACIDICLKCDIYDEYDCESCQKFY